MFRIFFGLLTFSLCAGLVTAADAPTFLADKIKLSKHVRHNALPLNWKSVLSGKEQVYYIGEQHSSGETRRELVKSMRGIKEAGITHLAMEMLAEEYADSIKKYCCDGSCQNDVFESFKKFGWDESGYMAMAEAAKEVGITVVAIDLPFSVRYEVTQKRNRLKYSDKAGDFEEYCRLGEDIYQKRDARMAENISKIIKATPHARVLAYVGSNHAEKTSQPKILIEKYGLSSRSYQPTGRQNEILKVLIESNRRDDALLIPVPVEQWGFDGFINYPIEWGVQRPLRPKVHTK